MDEIRTFDVICVEVVNDMHVVEHDTLTVETNSSEEEFVAIVNECLRHVAEICKIRRGEI